VPQDFDLSQFKATYFEECQDLLTSAEEYLAVLRADLSNVDIETLHAIFRSVHSIKGGAGAFNFVDLVEFSHVLETALDRLREGKITLSEEFADCLIRANDVLAVLVQCAQNDESVDPGFWKPLAQELDGYTKGKQTETPPESEKAAPDGLSELVQGYDLTPKQEEEQGWGLFLDNISPTKAEQIETPPVAEGHGQSSPGAVQYRILFVPEPHLLQFANEPLLLARELATLGEFKAQADVSRLPKLAEISPDIAYLSWTFDLTTDRDIADIEEVFEFVIDDCVLDIQKVDGAEEQPELLSSPEPMQPEAEPSEGEQEPGLPKQDALPKTAASAVVPSADQQNVTKPSQAKEAPRPGNVASPPISSIRVELDRVDKLVNMVGELVITQSMLKQQADDLPDNAGDCMARGFEELNARTRELQESVMTIRMQPVKSVFARMPRLVRELSGKLGKKVDLMTSGEMTEVDKTVIEQLMDPLTHMIRNCVDHGIETPAERAQTSKPGRATIHLRAEHKSGRIQIEVMDDGRGIDRSRVYQKALEKGLLTDEEVLDSDEIDNLIFQPGFTTAQEVSDVSGRGVGMDVVRRNVVSLGGRISVFSTPGEGTRFSMSLPLTLAVLDGMIVKCGPEKYIIPLTAVVESIHPMKEELKTLVSGGYLVSVRGEYIPIVNLHRLFSLDGAVTDPAEGLVVIVDTERFGHVGVLVDELLGQQQVVIKSLEENYDPIAGISAATILGNGKVALILDVDGLAEMEQRTDKRRKNLTLKQPAFLTGE